MGMGGPSRRSLRNGSRPRRESPAAARRSRPSKWRFEQGTQISKGCAGRWRTGRGSCGCCNDAEGWPGERHSWPTFARAARAWLSGQGGDDLAGAEVIGIRRKKARRGWGRAGGRGFDARR
jgi:hypothetical protein